MRKCALFGALMLCIQPAWAANWYEIAKARSGHDYYIDLSSIEYGKPHSSNNFDESLIDEPEKTVGFWIKAVYKYNAGTPSSQVARFNGNRIWYVMTRRKAYCDSGKISSEDNVIYGLSNQTLDYDYLSQVIRPVPDTTDEAIYKTVCALAAEHWQKEAAETPRLKPKAPEPEPEADFGPYMAELQRRIRRNWMPPVNDRNKVAVIVFKISKHGDVSDLSVEKSTGSNTADQAAILAIESSANFRELPSDFKGNSIRVRFVFEYEISGRSSAELLKEETSSQSPTGEPRVSDAAQKSSLINSILP